ncbi:MAG: hypothetical protein OEV87_07950 [Phycisphaerae bacterium]|nr:hypothetical protein [Phycisphaerae bacterium]
MKKIFALSMVAMMAASVMAFHGAESRCSSCHIVHMAGDNSGVPLWNTETVMEGANYTAYVGYDMDAQVDNVPAGASLLCLACHDGGTSHAIAPEQGDMTGTHPIGFVYDSALAQSDLELYDPTSSPSNEVGGGSTIADDLLSPDVIGGDNTILDCTACHDIHAQGLHDSIGIAVYQYDRNGNQLFEEDGVTPVLGGMSMPHLRSIPGVEWQYNSRSQLPVEDPAAYRLIYTPLCVTCHIK